MFCLQVVVLHPLGIVNVDSPGFDQSVGFLWNSSRGQREDEQGECAVKEMEACLMMVEWGGSGGSEANKGRGRTVWNECPDSSAVVETTLFTLGTSGNGIDGGASIGRGTGSVKIDIFLYSVDF